MMERSAWPLTLIAASMLAWVSPAPCAAQAPTGTSTPAPAAGPGAEPAAPMASTVSPAIERFLKQSGRSLPPPTALANAVDAQGRRALPRPIPPAQAVTRRAGQDAGRMPTALPPPGRRSSLATRVTLEPAPLASTDVRFPINLATALRLSDARPLIVAASQASVWEAEADLNQARVLWIPGLNMAADYLRHDGGGPDFNKGILTSPSVNFFYGGVGLWGLISTTDSIFQPLVARQVVNSRTWDVQTAKNDALLQTADAYFLVHQYRGTYAGTLYCVKRGRELVERLATMSRDLVQGFETDRARNMLADLEQKAVVARQQWRVQSANLTQVLRLDPRAVVEPMEPDHLQVTLIEPGRPMDELMRVAVTNRPEIASRRSMVEAATAGIRREKMRPLLPNVLISGFQSPGGMLIQAGIFGLGPNSSLSQWTGREDVSFQLMWQLENMGFGNLARIKRQRGEQSHATVDLLRTQDRVAADVNRTLARVQSAAFRVIQADRALRTGIINFNGNFEGLGETQRFGDVLVLINRPQEAVYALQLLNVAFDEYFSTVSEYNRAEFELFHALGYPAYEVSSLRIPGEVRPVETARPSFLPPVGTGPPPATR
jgi:hypothetical protein